MFAHLRLFSIISFFVVLVATLLVGGYIRTVTADGIVGNIIEKNNVAMAEFFIDNVWLKSNPYGANTIPEPFILPKDPHQDISQESLSDSVETAAQIFERRVMDYARNMPVVKFSIYDVTGNKIVSSNQNEILELRNIWTGWMSIFDGPQLDQMTMIQNVVATREPISTVIEKSAFRIAGGMIKEGAIVQTLLPIIPNGASKVEGVMEVFYDISQPWQHMHYFQLIGTAGIMFIFMIMYGALFITSAQAKRVIEEQHDKNVELMDAKVRAEAESKEKSQFLANVSHELRTPLNAIIGFSEIMCNESQGPIGNEQYKEYVTDIHTSGSHLLGLINDILDYSKAEAEKLDVEMVEVDITKIIKNSIRIVSSRAKEAQVETLDDLPEEHMIVIGDAKRLKQVFLNLLSNAVKFTPEGGKVTVIMRNDDEKEAVVVRVVDTGIGIAPKDISRAMATFGQVDSALSRRYEGTGLGLPLTKKLCELMQAKFYIESEQGLGTTITITFPYPKHIKEKSGEFGKI